MSQSPSPILSTGYLPGSPTVWGFRTETGAEIAKGDHQIFYVNAAHLGALDDNTGLDPQYPLATIQELIDRSTGVSTVTPRLATHDVIYVGGNVTESVIVPGTLVPTYVTIAGVGGRHSPTWTSAAANTPCLTLRREGWRVSNLTFNCPSASAGIQLHTSGADGYDAYKTVIDNCVFDGLWSGLYGIEFYGGTHRVGIYDNWFVEMNNANPALAWCIYITDSTDSNPYQCEIIGNRFMDSDNYVGSLGAIRGFNVSLFQGNVFEEGVLLTPTTYLDLRGGSRGYNIVTGNYFGGAYTNAGGYYANAATPNSCWVGNIAEPTPATVADNGFTIAVPA